MREVPLRLACLMRGDLCRCGALPIHLSEVVFDLLPSRTGRVEVLLGVPANLRLATFAAVDFVTQGRQPCGQLRSIQRRRIRLASKQFTRLQGSRLAIVALRDVEDDN